MTRNQLLPILLLTLAGIALPDGTARAQFEAADAPVEGDNAPFVPNLEEIENPAVLSAFDRPREEPRDYLRSVLQLLDLGEPQLAKVVMDELLAKKIIRAAKAELVREFGTVSMLRLERAKELGPEASEFARSAIESAAAEATADNRIAGLIDDLAAEGPAYKKAIVALSALGEPAVVPCLGVLQNNESSPTARRGAMTCLVRLRPYSAMPLMAALESGDAQLESDSAYLLSVMKIPQAAPLLAAGATSAPEGSAIDEAYQAMTGQEPTATSAEAFLRRTLKNLESGVTAFRPDATGMVKYALWDAQASAPKPLMLPADDATLVHRARLARDLASVRPDSLRYRTQAIRLDLEAAQRLGYVGVELGGLGANLKDLAGHEVNLVLTEALRHAQHSAAVAALHEIADRNEAGMLYSDRGLPSPTAKALKARHPSVRFAALSAIASIDSPSTFPGASYVCPAIVRMASARGGREVVVASPALDQAATWAADLAAEGYEGHVAATGADAFAAATERADVELIVLDMSIGHPEVREVVYQLRSAPGTALVPVVLLAREWQISKARRIAEDHEGVVAYLRPHTVEAMTTIAADAASHLPRDWPSAAERVSMAHESLEVTSKFLAADRDFYRLRAAADMLALSVPLGEASEESWKMVAQLGTADSQVMLTSVAGNAALPAETRQAASDAFRASVEEFGLLLTTDQIVLQYDRYNASLKVDQDEAKFLAGLLDTIELKRKKQLEVKHRP